LYCIVATQNVDTVVVSTVVAMNIGLGSGAPKG
jgi:hypothetical protein